MLIRSPDTLRDQRLPPGQTLTARLPNGHVGGVPPFDASSWDLTLFPKPFLKQVVRFTWPQFQQLPRVQVLADYHCVTGFSKLDNLWEGVATRELLKHISLQNDPKFVMIHCEFGYTANVAIDDFLAEDALLATRVDGADLSADQGGPVRLILPRLYAWKSGKWVRGIEFLAEDHPGYWESPDTAGLHHRGDPWREERNAQNRVDYLAD